MQSERNTGGEKFYSVNTSLAGDKMLSLPEKVISIFYIGGNSRKRVLYRTEGEKEQVDERKRGREMRKEKSVWYSVQRVMASTAGKREGAWRKQPANESSEAPEGTTRFFRVLGMERDRESSVVRRWLVTKYATNKKMLPDCLSAWLPLMPWPTGRIRRYNQTSPR